jgi:hypothetical protein
MSIFDRFTKLRHPLLTELIKEQRFRELFTKREFRFTEDYFRRELVPRLEYDEVRGISLVFGDGFGELTGEVKKRLLPAITFRARFAVARVIFTPKEKQIHLRLDEVHPVDFDWLTRRMVERLPYLTYDSGGIICDLARVPQLTELFAYHVKGVRVSDFLTIKDLELRPGEVAGRLGFVI